jgi:hypothetical protein
MPFVTYFYNRIRSGKLTVVDCFDLIFQSTVTHTLAGANWTAMQHPPHPHAHIAREGFNHQLSRPQAGRCKHLQKAGSLDTARLTELAELRVKKQVLDRMNLEGLHIDPTTRNQMDPQREIVDPSRGSPYANRQQHSQFEDSEVASMALYYALLSDAGQAALDWLLQAPDRRSVLTSRSAADALNGRPIPYQNPPPKLSEPLVSRRGSPQVVERSSGGAGLAVTQKARIEEVKVILDSQVGDVLKLTTFYPVSTLDPGIPPNIDRVEQKIGNSLHGSPIDKPKRARSALTWSDPVVQRGWLDSSSTGLVCRKCAAEHTSRVSFVFGRWHQCRKCGTVFCAKCGDRLSIVSSISRDRRCPQPACGGTTQLID